MGLEGRQDLVPVLFQQRPLRHREDTGLLLVHVRPVEAREHRKHVGKQAAVGGPGLPVVQRQRQAAKQVFSAMVLVLQLGDDGVRVVGAGLDVREENLVLVPMVTLFGELAQVVQKARSSL